MSRMIIAFIVIYSISLTPSTPAVPNCCCSKGLMPYWSNPPFLIFDIRALWRSVLSARVPECQKLTRGSAIAEEPRDALRQLKYYGRFLTKLLTRSSANPQEPCKHTVSWNRVNCCKSYKLLFDGLHVKTSATGEWPSKSFKVTAIATIW